MVLSGPRALLLELAHPLVAAGVAEHSDFRRRPMGRLFRTLGVMTALNFETGPKAQAAAAHTRKCHSAVQGHLREDVGPYPAGTPYRAADPLLQLWVLSTLVDSVLVTYDHLVRPLSLAEKQAYYVGAQRLARAFGIPPELTPPEYDDFQTYVDAMLTSDALTVGSQAREVAAGPFQPRLLGPTVQASSFISMGLTPPHLREAFGFRWTSADERRFQWLGAPPADCGRWRPRRWSFIRRRCWLSGGCGTIRTGCAKSTMRRI